MKLREQSHPLNTITDGYGEKGGSSKQKAGQSKPCSCCHVSRLGWTPRVHCYGLILLLQRSCLEGSVCIALHIRLAEVTSDSCDRVNSQLHIGCLPVIPEHEVCNKPTLGWSFMHSYFFVHLTIHSLILIPYSFMEFL